MEKLPVVEKTRGQVEIIRLEAPIMTLARNLRVSKKTVRRIQPIWRLGSWMGELERRLEATG